jgi:hypothetical protein
MDGFGGALSSNASGYLLLEFTPDMKRFFRKYAPKNPEDGGKASHPCRTQGFAGPVSISRCLTDLNAAESW